MSNPASNTSISFEAISNALALLLRDIRRVNKDDVVPGDSSKHLSVISNPFEQLDKDAQELETILSAFTYHTRSKIAEIRRRRNALSPVYRLPTELLQIVFRLRVSENYFSKTKKVKENMQARYQLAEFETQHVPRKWDPKKILPDTLYSATVKMAVVSSYWYKVAISTPQIWPYLDTRHNLELISVILQRSNGRPLSLSCSAEVNQEHEHRFLDLLIPYIHIWKSFESSSSCEVFRGFNAEVHSPSMLEQIIIPKHANRGWYQLIDLILDRSPNLKSLHISSLEYPIGSTHPCLSGITNLSVRATSGGVSFPMEKFRCLFEGMPELEIVYIKGTSYILREASLFSAPLPRLKSIHLDSLPHGYAIALLHSIIPNADLCPVAKVTGYQDMPYSGNALMDPTRPHSLLAVIFQSTTWFSVSHDHRRNGDMHSRMGKEVNGVRTTLLEVIGIAGIRISPMVALICPDGRSKIRALELDFWDGLDVIQLATNLGLHPHLENLSITEISDYNSKVLIQALASPTECQHLKRLSFKGLDYFEPLLESVKARYGPSQHDLITSGCLTRLEKLELQDSPMESDEVKRQLESFLAAQNIQFEMIPYQAFASP